jgi:hypothetical protein
LRIAVNNETSSIAILDTDHNLEVWEWSEEESSLEKTATIILEINFYEFYNLNFKHGLISMQVDCYFEDHSPYSFRVYSYKRNEIHLVAIVNKPISSFYILKNAFWVET